MIPSRNSILFLLIGLFLATSPIFSEKDPKEEYKARLLGKEKDKLHAIRGVKENEMHFLLPIVSEILKEESSNEEILIEITNLYESYGEDLESHLPNAIEDYEWILNSVQNEVLVTGLLKAFYVRRDKRFLYSVTGLITHRSAEVRRASFQYLDSFKDDRILPYILELGNSDRPINRYYYLEALNYINDERAAVHVSKLLNDPSPALRMQAISVVEKFKMKDKLYPVLNMARNDFNYEVRKIATLYAKSQNQKYRTDIFQGGLSDPHPEVREAAIDSIHSFKDAFYAQAVSKTLEKEELSRLRIKLIDSLLIMNNHGGGQGLAVALRKDPLMEVRKKAAYATARLSAKSVVPALLSSLSEEPSVEVKVEVTKTLGVLKEKSAVPVLLSYLRNQSEDRDLRKEMLFSLDLINDPKVLPFIFDMLDEENTEFRFNMREFLRTMLYRYHGGNPNRLVVKS